MPETDEACAETLGRAKTLGQIELLKYLISVARDSQGAEIWRALFSEQLKRLERTIEDSNARQLVALNKIVADELAKIPAGDDGVIETL